MKNVPEGYELQINLAEAHYAALTMQKSTEYRGAYIAQTIQVERQVNYILAVLFGGSVQQQQAFQRVVLERSPGINLSLKIDLMLDGFQTRYPDLYQRFNNEGLFSQLQEVRTRRNRLAHVGDNTSPEYIRERMRQSPGVIEAFALVYWSKGEWKMETVTVPEMQQHLLQVNRVTVGLARVLDAVHAGRKTYDEEMLAKAFPEL